jgi:triphosphoribosyl-dephospho-CoA synthase
VLALGWPGAREGREALAELDGWLRAEGHRRNPGATADLLTAALFVLLREGAIRLPAEVPWEAGFGR